MWMSALIRKWTLHDVCPVNHKQSKMATRNFESKENIYTIIIEIQAKKQNLHKMLCFFIAFLTSTSL